MARLAKQKAVEQLAAAIRTASADDLVEIHNELFPGQPITEPDAKRRPSEVADKVLRHVDGGLESEEVLALWNVVFPEHRDVRFDEEEGTLHYELDEQAARM